MKPIEYKIKYDLKEILDCLKSDSNSSMPQKEKFQKDPKHYYEVLLEYKYILDNFKYDNKDSEEIWGRYAWTLYVYASWGFSFNAQKSFKYGLLLLKSRDKDLRSIGAIIFSELKKNKEYLNEIHNQLLNETDEEVIDMLIISIGQIKDKSSLSVLNKILINKMEDNDTIDLIADATTKITKVKFLRDKNLKENIRNWYNENI